MFKPADLEDWVRLLTSLLVGAYAGWALAGRGWAWVSWLPAAFLAFAGASVLWVLIWYLRRKLTYEDMARHTKADLRAGGDGWPNARRG